MMSLHSLKPPDNPAKLTEDQALQIQYLMGRFAGCFTRLNIVAGQPQPQYKESRDSNWYNYPDYNYITNDTIANYPDFHWGMITEIVYDQ